MERWKLKLGDSFFMVWGKVGYFTFLGGPIIFKPLQNCLEILQMPILELPAVLPSYEELEHFGIYCLFLWKRARGRAWLLNSRQQKSKELLSLFYFLQVYPYSSITKTCNFLDNFADMIITGIYLKHRDEARDIVTNERQLRVLLPVIERLKISLFSLLILLWEILIFSIGKTWLKFQI